jgi:hypothetical protein
MSNVMCEADDYSPPVRVYIAGPMTGYPEYNFPAFHHTAQVMRDIGYTVISPAELEEGKLGETWEYYMRRDLPLLCTCDMVVVLEGWEKSRGARLEVQTARALGIPVCDRGLKPLSDEPPAEVAVGSITEEAERLVQGARNGDYSVASGGRCSPATCRRRSLICPARSSA